MPEDAVGMTPFLDRVIDEARAVPGGPIAVVYPCEPTALAATVAITEAGLGEVILIGPTGRIASAAERSGASLKGVEIVDTPDDPFAATSVAIALVQASRATSIMKGSLHTDELLSMVLKRESGLRTTRRLSHCFAFEVEGSEEPLLLTDCVVNIQPDLMAKRDIAQNAIDLSLKLDVDRPRVAVLSAIESVNPSVQSSLDAAALAKMASRGQLIGAEVDGPLSFDVAVSISAAEIKRVQSEVAGRANILLVPNLDAGNALYKCLTYKAQARCAGIVVGAKVPIILTSRADSKMTRVCSAAMAKLAG